MSDNQVLCNAEVIAVYPDKIKIQVYDIQDFIGNGSTLQIGSYLRVFNTDNAVLIAMVENFSIGFDKEGGRVSLLDALPLGMIKDDQFIRGGDSLAIPPKRFSPLQLRI